MKIAVVYAAMLGFEQGINIVKKYVCDTLEELGVDIDEINISHLNIDYYDGVKQTVVENAFNQIKDADGVIFAFSALRLAPCGMMQMFIEHLDYNVYGSVLKDKNCFTVITSSDGSEIRAEEYITTLIQSLGGAVINRLAIGSNYLGEIDRNSDIKEMIEKYAEDFYRMLRQNRKFFISSSSPIEFNQVNVAQKQSILKDNGSQVNNNYNNTSYNNQNYNVNNTKKLKPEDLMGSLDLSDFNEKQEDDINEITKLISQSYNNNANNNTGRQKAISNLYRSNMTNESISQVTPRVRSCKQMTQSLYHYFQPQLARDINAIYQINIKGDEKFESYITIRDNECECFDGISNEPDVIIYANSDDWRDILNGKYTTQKGFMTGKLKVRGNFILLSKFDQLFKLGD